MIPWNISLYSKESTDKEVLIRSFYLATLTIFGLYCLRSCNRVFIVFPVSMISFKRAKRKTHVIAFLTKHYSFITEGNKSTYLHYQDILWKEKNHKLSKILSNNSKKKKDNINKFKFLWLFNNKVAGNIGTFYQKLTAVCVTFASFKVFFPHMRVWTHRWVTGNYFWVSKWAFRVTESSQV